MSEVPSNRENQKTDREIPVLVTVVNFWSECVKRENLIYFRIICWMFKKCIDYFIVKSIINELFEKYNVPYVISYTLRLLQHKLFSLI